MGRGLRFVFFGFFLLAACRSNRAQQVNAAMRGTALDPSGATVAAASVTATQLETGYTRRVLTDAEGDFVLVELPVGHYRLQAEAKGFQRCLQEGLSVKVNQTAGVLIRFRIGPESEQIEVAADVPLVESASTSLGKAVGEREIRDLPLNGRHFTQLGTLQP